MRDFWWFARRMLRHRGEIMLLLIGASVSAGGLGAGLLSLGPVLRLILAEGGSLAQLCEQWNGKHDWPKVPEALMAPSTPTSASPSATSRSAATMWKAGNPSA